MGLKFFRALFFDDKGEYLGKKYFNPKKENHFKYNNKRYSYDGRVNTYMREDNFYLFFKRRTYFYYLNNPSPISFNIKKKNYNEMNAESLNILMETKVIKDINDISKPSIFSSLNIKTIGIIIVALIVLYYLFTGGKLF